jgi:hypothetical protein
MFQVRSLRGAVQLLSSSYCRYLRYVDSVFLHSTDSCLTTIIISIQVHVVRNGVIDPSWHITELMGDGRGDTDSLTIADYRINVYYECLSIMKMSMTIWH